MGGGTQNELLNQMTADATGCEIIAGPIEATSVGNILVQMIATGELGSLSEGRELVANSFEPKRYEPKGNPEQWEEAYLKMRAIKQR